MSQDTDYKSVFLLNILSFWTNHITNFSQDYMIMPFPICCFRFSIFVLETFKFEWHCSQYLELNPAYATARNLIVTPKQELRFF